MEPRTSSFSEAGSGPRSGKRSPTRRPALARTSPSGGSSSKPAPLPSLPFPIVIGVLAFQGAFREHVLLLNKAAKRLQLDEHRFSAILVRSSAELAMCHGLLIPGGESTAIAMGAKRADMLDDLRRWVANDRPTWGTCAGMILLAREASGGKRGGQELIGGMDVRVGRNGFGSQVDSFETMLDIPMAGDEPFPAVFIRAPVVDCLLDPQKASPLPEGVTVVEENDVDPMHVVKLGSGKDGQLPPKRALPIVVAPPLTRYRTAATASTLAPSAVALEEASIANAPGSSTSHARPPLQILAALSAPVTSPVAPPQSGPAPDILAAPHILQRDAEEDSDGRRTPTGPPKLTGLVPRPGQDNQIVALRQGNLMSTSFHPELTPDPRLHIYFMQQVVIPPLSEAAGSPAPM